MTVTTTTRFDVFVADGIVTDFAFTFDRVAKSDDTDITVYLRDESVTPATQTLQANPADYTVDDPSGEVRFGAAPASALRVVIIGAHPNEQPTDYLNNSVFPAETHETALDRVTILAQQNAENIDRCLKVPETSIHATTAFDPSLPEPEASEFIQVKSDLTGYQSTSKDDIVTGADHTLLSNIGTNSHSAIDTHIANTSNPHGVTVSQALTADGGTDATAAEIEELTDGSTTTLHTHASLSLDINALTAETPVADDEFIFADDSDSFNNKKVTLTDLATAIGSGTDADAIHDNVAAEISAITDKPTPVAADHMIIEDSADSDNKKSMELGNLLDNTLVNDQAAIHDDVASEISAITAKGTPTTADFLLIEDAADSNNKKRITIGDLPGGSAAISGVNAITNGHFEADASDWVAYQDASAATPVDGVGGTPTVTITQSATTPLRGAGSGIFTKDAADRRGEGASSPFELSSDQTGQENLVSLEYFILSGTYASGDMGVYIIDEDNGTVINPETVNIPKPDAAVRQGGVFLAKFDATDATNYRLCLHVRSVSASAYSLKLDSVNVGGKVNYEVEVVILDSNALGSSSTKTLQWAAIPTEIRPFSDSGFTSSGTLGDRYHIQVGGMYHVSAQIGDLSSTASWDMGVAVNSSGGSTNIVSLPEAERVFAVSTVNGSNDWLFGSATRRFQVGDILQCQIGANTAVNSANPRARWIITRVGD